MPTSGFETALTERIEFAVFVAYEQWVRASNYAAPNPYDVLARLITGLPEALSEAAANRGGWGAFDPVSGLPTDTARQLIGEMAAQVVSARVAALAPHAPDANLLAQVVVDAVSRSVTVFVDDPESWRLALNPNERAPTAALGEAAPGQAQAADAEMAQAEYHPPELPPDEGGEYGAAAAPVPRTAEALHDRSNFLQLAEFWFIKSSSTAPSTDASVAALGNLLVGGSSSVSLVEASEELGQELAELRDGAGGTEGGAPTAPGELAGGIPVPPNMRAEHLDALDDLPMAIQVVIAKWVRLLNEASFWRIGDDGQPQRLSEAEAHEVVDTLIGVLIRRAELDLALPRLPAQAETPPAPPPQPGLPPPDAALAPPDAGLASAPPQADMPASIDAGLGSGSIDIPRPADPGADHPVAPPADLAWAPAVEDEAVVTGTPGGPPPEDLTPVAALLPPIIKDADPLFG